MRVEDAIRIRHMIDAAELALEFVGGRARADLDRDNMLRFALVQAIQVVGAKQPAKFRPNAVLICPLCPGWLLRECATGSFMPISISKRIFCGRRCRKTCPICLPTSKRLTCRIEKMPSPATSR